MMTSNIQNFPDIKLFAGPSRSVPIEIHNGHEARPVPHNELNMKEWEITSRLGQKSSDDMEEDPEDEDWEDEDYSDEDEFDDDEEFEYEDEDDEDEYWEDDDVDLDDEDDEDF